MLPRLFLAALLVAAAIPASAQVQRRPPESGGNDGGGQQSTPQPAPPPERRAVPRQPAPPPTTATRDEPASGGQRTAEPRRRPPDTADGRREGDRVAVPRTRRAPEGRDRGDRDRDDRIVVARPWPSYYYYPRYSYPYGYGAFGLGYFYYDPWGWGPRQPLRYYGGYNYWGYGYSYDVGEVRLQVTPRDAQVFVDGYYAGVVDDFDGFFQSLRLESGGYRIEVRYPGFQTETFDVYVTPGRKINYRAQLRPAP